MVSFALSLALASCARQGGDTSGALTPTQIADRVRPVTLAIVGEFQVQGSVPRMDLNTGKLEQILQQRHFSTRQEALEGIVNAFLNNPADYVREGETVEFKKAIHSLGTGFIITFDGYILSNAHVVQPEEEDLKKASVDSVRELVDDDTRRLQSFVEQLLSGESISEKGLQELREALASFYAQRAQIRVSRSLVAVMPSSQGESSERLNDKACALKQIGAPAPGKDIAVLKIEGSDLPTIPLAPKGQDNGTRKGSELLVFGYQGKVALDIIFTLQSRMQPSLTIGHVSGTKRMADGWDVIQTDASINPGNSGGPVMNDRGQVVGLATFGFLEFQGLNFAVSIDVARPFLENLGVKPRQSSFSRKYNRALAQYDKPGHGEAHRLFTELHEQYPEEGIVTSFVRQMDGQPVTVTQVTTPAPEKQPKASGFSRLLVLAFSAIVVGLLALIISSDRR